jgi:hypothetical protein
VVDGKDLSHDDRLTFQHKNITREITEKLLLYPPNDTGSGYHVPFWKYPDGTKNDLKNNAEGVGCAEGQPCNGDVKKDCMTCCMQKFMAGSLSYSQ